MRISVDYQRCVGNGFCEAIDEDTFEVGEDGVLHVLVEDVVDDAHRDRVNEAIAQCPTGALSLVPPSR